MKFALIDNIKTAATKGAKGICPNCNSVLIAKCGEVKISHWAHKGIRNCDPWWENETEWHRCWKDNFPNDWQEVVLTDETTGEKHIADIQNSSGVVIEFQHSHIDPIERTKREQFYKKMVWVVDGTRLKKDYPRFLKAKDTFRLTGRKGYFIVDFPDECFPAAWLNSNAPIIFDFKGIEKISYANDWRYPLYCLFPKSNSAGSVVAIISRQSFIQSIVTGSLFQEERMPEKPIVKPLTKSTTAVQRRASQYVFERGRLVKRRRL